MRKRIRDVETVAKDLFAEWEKEIVQISTTSLQAGTASNWPKPAPVTNRCTPR